MVARPPTPQPGGFLKQKRIKCQTLRPLALSVSLTPASRASARATQSFPPVPLPSRLRFRNARRQKTPVSPPTRHEAVTFRSQPFPLAF